MRAASMTRSSYSRSISSISRGSVTRGGLGIGRSLPMSSALGSLFDVDRGFGLQRNDDRTTACHLYVSAVGTVDSEGTCPPPETAKNRPGLRLAQAGPGRVGQAVVEFALVLPIFVMLLCGVLDGGRIVYAWNALSDMARTAGRAVSVHDWPAVCAGIAHDPAGAQTCVNAIIATQLVGVPGAVGTVTCVPSGCGPDAKMTVRVSAKMTLVTPILAQIMDSPNVTGVTEFVVIG